LILLSPCGRLLRKYFRACRRARRPGCWPFAYPRRANAGQWTASLRSIRSASMPHRRLRRRLCRLARRRHRPRGLGTHRPHHDDPRVRRLLSHVRTEAAPGPTARAWRGRASGTNSALVHIRFRSPAPRLAGGGNHHRAGRGSGPRASGSERSRRAAPSSEVSPSAALVPHRPRRDFCSGSRGAPLRLLGPLEVPRRPLDRKGLLGRRSSGESELLFARAIGRSSGATKPSALGILAAATLSNRTKRRSTWIPAFAGMTKDESRWVPAVAGMTTHDDPASNRPRHGIAIAPAPSDSARRGSGRRAGTRTAPSGTRWSS
jgi:hypothetical protein